MSFDFFITHNKFGEYGHLHHKVINYIIMNIHYFKNKKIITTSNHKTDFFVQNSKEEKQDMLKKYTFKDDENNKNVWFNQCIKSYSFWANNQYEYFEIIE